MIKYCVEKWDKNKGRLEEKLRRRTDLNSCGYETLVRMVVDFILNDEDQGGYGAWNSRKITEIDNGGSQGTLLYVIPLDVYSPDETECLMTCISYGSCSGCDTLLAIQKYGDGILTEQQVKDFMALCKDIVCNMVKPYNVGWRFSEEFLPIEDTQNGGQNDGKL